MSSDNTCERCGGSKTSWFQVDLQTLVGEAETIAQYPAGMLKLCMCSPEQPKPEEYTDLSTGVHLTVKREGEKVDALLQWCEWDNLEEINQGIARVMQSAGLTWER